MSETKSVGIKFFLLGNMNIVVLTYSWFSRPEIFNSALSKTIIYTLLGQISYGDLVQVIYTMTVLGVLFSIIGLAFIFDRKHFI